MAAPGTGVPSLDPRTGYNVFGGTSAAAPHVAGAAAVLMGQRKWLMGWPEVVKAAMTAGALDNVEGLSRISDRDGAGSISMLANSQMLERQQAIPYRLPSCSTMPPVPIKRTIHLEGGRRTRVAVAFDTGGSYLDAYDYQQRPSADLDLLVWKRTSGFREFVASSQSWGSTFEIVEFTPDTPATYDVEVVNFRCEVSPRYLGLAWIQE